MKTEGGRAESEQIWIHEDVIQLFNCSAVRIVGGCTQQWAELRVASLPRQGHRTAPKAGKTLVWGVNQGELCPKFLGQTWPSVLVLQMCSAAGHAL